MLKLIIPSIFALFSAFAPAPNNTWEPPSDYELTDSADYDTYANDMVECAEWYATTPYNFDEIAFIRAAKFNVAWTNGSPRVTLIITEATVTELCKKNTGFLAVFMSGFCANHIKSGYTATQLENQLAAYRLVFKVYENAAKKTKDKKLEKLMAMDDEALESHIQKSLP